MFQNICQPTHFSQSAINAWLVDENWRELSANHPSVFVSSPARVRCDIRCYLIAWASAHEHFPTFLFRLRLSVLFQTRLLIWTWLHAWNKIFYPERNLSDRERILLHTCNPGLRLNLGIWMKSYLSTCFSLSTFVETDVIVAKNRSG